MNLDRTAGKIHNNDCHSCKAYKKICVLLGLAIAEGYQKIMERRNGMNAAHRRMEIVSILAARGHITMQELAWELEVSRRTIEHDVVTLSLDYPIYTKPGEGGGIFITKDYKPYGNTLTQTEQETLSRMYHKAEGRDKEILFRIIRKYGAYNLKI